MKKLTLVFLLAASLQACGGSSAEASSDPVPTQAAEIQTQSKTGEQFTVAIRGETPQTVDGYGDDPMARRYDAVAYVASQIQPESYRYRQMQSDLGLYLIVDGINLCIVNQKSDGLHINCL